MELTLWYSYLSLHPLSFKVTFTPKGNETFRKWTLSVSKLIISVLNLKRQSPNTARREIGHAKGSRYHNQTYERVRYYVYPTGKHTNSSPVWGGGTYVLYHLIQMRNRKFDATVRWLRTNQRNPNYIEYFRFEPPKVYFRPYFSLNTFVFKPFPNFFTFWVYFLSQYTQPPPISKWCLKAVG